MMNSYALLVLFLNTNLIDGRVFSAIAYAYHQNCVMCVITYNAL
jgi:hypothetical protein